MNRCVIPISLFIQEKCNKRKHEGNYPLSCGLQDKRERIKRSQRTSGNCLRLDENIEDIILGNFCVYLSVCQNVCQFFLFVSVDIHALVIILYRPQTKFGAR